MRFSSFYIACIPNSTNSSVSYNDGQRVSLSHIETTFFECSTAQGPDDVDTVFNDMLQKVSKRVFCLQAILELRRLVFCI